MAKRSSVFVGAALAIFLSAAFGWAQAQDPKKLMSIEAYDMLNTVPDTYLIDIRSQAEYQFVGHPSKAYNFPYMFLTGQFNKDADKPGYMLTKNKAFLDQVGKAFKKTDNLLILGRDGSISSQAAKELTGAGFKNVFDVEDGFEGPEFPFFEDPNRHKYYRQLAKRNNIHGFEHRRFYGWQAWGLPWTYEMDPRYVYPPDLAPGMK
ncbi:MAG: rhodanese-like domain-containing protein [Desulfatiglandales bacterium]